MAVISQKIADRYAAYNSDCMEVLPELRSESIGLSIYSPPFPETFAYSNDPRDMANTTDYGEAIKQFGFIVKEIHRLTIPGRATAVHCMDLKKGSWYQRDFPGSIVRIHEDAGFHFFCRITIWKDPWLIARRTRMRSLMHKTIVNDSAMSRVAGPDYVLVFKKGGENPQPVKHPAGLKRYAGATPIPADLLDRFVHYEGDQRKNLLSHWIWRNYASPVWMDIRAGRLLPYRQARENDEEKHVCPLQLDVIERALTLWSNPGDTILTPFMGVGSEICMSLAMNRRAIGAELKTTYYNQALANIDGVLSNGLPDGDEATMFDDESLVDDPAAD